MRTTSKSDLVGTTRGTATRTFNLISHMIQDILTLSFIVRSCLVGWLSDLESYTVHQWGRGGDRGVLLHLAPLPFFFVFRGLSREFEPHCDCADTSYKHSQRYSVL